MKTALFTFLIALFLVSAPLSVQAQSIEFTRAVQDLRKMNRVPPQQNPQYQSSEKVMKGHVMDRTKKTVGEIHDILLRPSGAIDSLHVEFDRLRLSTQVYVDYSDMGMRPTSSGYITSFEDDQIEAVFPELLANIQTAAGNEDILSTKKLIGRKVQSKDGRNLGQVEDILFDAEGGRADALFVKMNFGRLTGKGIAIPFGVARYETVNYNSVFQVTNRMADAMIEVAKFD